MRMIKLKIRHLESRQSQANKKFALCTLKKLRHYLTKIITSSKYIFHLLLKAILELKKKGTFTYERQKRYKDGKCRPLNTPVEGNKEISIFQVLAIW